MNVCAIKSNFNFFYTFAFNAITVYWLCTGAAAVGGIDDDPLNFSIEISRNRIVTEILASSLSSSMGAELDRAVSFTYLSNSTNSDGGALNTGGSIHRQNLAYIDQNFTSTSTAQNIVRKSAPQRSTGQEPFNFSINMFHNRMVIENLASLLSFGTEIEDIVSLKYVSNSTSSDDVARLNNKHSTSSATDADRNTSRKPLQQQQQQSWMKKSLPIIAMRPLEEIKKLNRDRQRVHGAMTTAKTIPAEPSTTSVTSNSLKVLTAIDRLQKSNITNGDDSYDGTFVRQFPWTMREYTQTVTLTSIVGRPVVYTDVIAATDSDEFEQFQSEIVQIFTETLYRMRVLFPKVYDTVEFLNVSRTSGYVHSLSVHVFNTTGQYEYATKSNSTCGRFVRSYNRERYVYDIYVNYRKPGCLPHRTYQHEYVHFLEGVPSPYEIRYDPVWWTEGLALTLTSTCKFDLSDYVKNYTLYEMVASNDLDPYPIGQILHEFFSSRETLRKSYETLASAFVHGNGKLFYQTAFDAVLKHQDSFILKKCI